MTPSLKTTSDYNSSVNQRIKEKFVDIHVHANVNSMVDYILTHESRDAPFAYEDIENYYMYPEWSETVVGEKLYFEGGDESQWEDFKENFDRLEQESVELFAADAISGDTHERNLELIAGARAEFDELDTEPQEIYQWFLVDDFLCRKLKEFGECVISGENLWGRGACGQAILLDSVISRICEDMRILDGQYDMWY